MSWPMNVEASDVSDLCHEDHARLSRSRLLQPTVCGRSTTRPSSTTPRRHLPPTLETVVVHDPAFAAEHGSRLSSHQAPSQLWLSRLPSSTVPATSHASAHIWPTYPQLLQRLWSVAMSTSHFLADRAEISRLGSALPASTSPSSVGYLFRTPLFELQAPFRRCHGHHGSATSIFLRDITRWFSLVARMQPLMFAALPFAAPSAGVNLLDWA